MCQLQISLENQPASQIYTKRNSDRTQLLENPIVRVPMQNECLEMLGTMEMPDHIQEHSRLVCRVALALADGLIAAGLGINRELVMASALLHDITKPRSFETGENHAQTGGEYLAQMGFPEVGNIVRQHVVLDHYPQKAAPSEAEIVNYADKRVLHDQVVPLDDRMTYILTRYAKTRQRQALFHQLWDNTRKLEQRLFSHLAFPPDAIPLGVKNEEGGG
jgi:uncharacterized protein